MRVLEGDHGTAANVRVLITFGDSKGQWTTVGAGVDSIKASFIALTDGLSFKLMRDGVRALQALEPIISETVST